MAGVKSHRPSSQERHGRDEIRATDIQSPQSMGTLQGQAHRRCRQMATSKQIQPWTQRSKGTPPPSRGLMEPGGPGPTKQPLGVSQHTPKHRALDTENHQHTGLVSPHLMGGLCMTNE
ncbi:hypothetical protein XENOCAPTIV_005806 [Xenoophorus captivus]|uniref:Uncharacterized protein n=1 Tax=Xenoophorus captivus TaxID=1517983 RepID=A0ABV0QYQ3_9TELE